MQGVLKQLKRKSYGKLTPIGEPFRENRRTYIMASCSCGSAPKKYRIEGIESGHSRSCGCFHKEFLSKMQTTHGIARHPVYKVYKALMDRCYNPKNKSYKRYGGRGISVCDEWRNDIKSFYDWSLVNGWANGLTIERENNEGNYEPSNCKDIPHSMQSRNRSITKLNEEKVEQIRNLYRIDKKTQREIADIYGISNGCVSNVCSNKVWK